MITVNGLQAVLFGLIFGAVILSMALVGVFVVLSQY